MLLGTVQHESLTYLDVFKLLPRVREDLLCLLSLVVGAEGCELGLAALRVALLSPRQQ